MFGNDQAVKNSWLLPVCRSLWPRMFKINQQTKWQKRDYRLTQKQPNQDQHANSSRTYPAVNIDCEQNGKNNQEDVPNHYKWQQSQVFDEMFYSNLI